MKWPCPSFLPSDWPWRTQFGPWHKRLSEILGIPLVKAIKRRERAMAWSSPEPILSGAGAIRNPDKQDEADPPVMGQHDTMSDEDSLFSRRPSRQGVGVGPELHGRL